MLYQTINVQLPTFSYPIYIGHNLLHEANLFMPHIHGKQVMIVTQKEVADFYLERLLLTLKDYNCDEVYFPSGERHKTLKTWSNIINSLLAKGHERSTTVVALGGGIVGDVAGFAAACYQRGVNYIQIPTTLIAQVDAAIGGKTGVNHAVGKNLLGAFHHPQCVIADISLLASLPKREFIAGLAEVIKCSLIQDKKFFFWLEGNMPHILAGNQHAISEMVCHSAGIKARIVSQDDREQKNIRHLLNFGHSASHALEALNNYRMLHGEAVAWGMNIASLLSVEKGWLSQNDYERIYQLLVMSQLPLRFNKRINHKKFLTLLSHDKKNLNQALRFILLKDIGKAEITTTVTKEDVIRIISRL